MTTKALQEQKSLLRKRIGQEIARLGAEEISQQSASITRKVLEMKEYQTATSISIFLSMPGKEISTRDIVLHAFQDKKTVFIPYIHTPHGSKAKTMDMLELHNTNDLESLKPDTWGIPSLSTDSIQCRKNALGGLGVQSLTNTKRDDSGKLDLIFMPSVAFDRSHRRLGHGRGFYDRYLQQYKDALGQSTAAMPFLVGLALTQQLLSSEDEVPVNEEDWQVNVVVTADVVF